MNREAIRRRRALANRIWKIIDQEADQVEAACTLAHVLAELSADNSEDAAEIYHRIALAIVGDEVADLLH